jgi:formylmethanofuran dehydrogenase subunit B
VATVEGVPAERDAALDRAATILKAARAPVVFGLTRTATETVQVALELVDRLRARVFLDRSEHDLGRVTAFQNTGRVTATLGEVKNRADLVVFWNTDPIRTHPRHLERYSADPIGRFVPGGRAGRSLVVVAPEKTATADRADSFVRLSADRQLEALLTLRALVQGQRHVTPYDNGLEILADRMKQARYGVLFFQSDLRSRAQSARTWEAAAKLVRDLNGVTRFVLLGMGGAGNLAGAEAVLSWQSGYLQGADYAAGVPSPLDEDTTLDELLQRREIDVLVAVDDAFPPALSGLANTHLSMIPTILMGPGATGTGVPPPTVALASATAGFDAPGSVTRVDGISLPLRPVRSATLPTDRELIQALVERLSPRAEGQS